jgi:hypothetical protein
VNLRVSQTDVSRLGKFTRTGAGAVRIPATVSRTGVQVYPGAGPKGETLRQYRPESEVFAADSIASMAGIPVTLGHPPALVTPANARDYQIGHVSDAAPETRVTVDGSAELWTKTVLVVADGSVLGDIDSTQDAFEVSAGYCCDLEMTAGVAPNGEAYDAIQRNIKWNHVAILPPKMKARAGAEAKLRLDNKETPMKVIVIDGVEYEQGSDKHVAKIQQDAAAAVKVASDRADKAEAQRDTEKERADKAEKASSVEALDAKVEARFNLLKTASKFLPASYDTKGKSDAQVRADAVSAKIGADKIAGKSEAYVEARFDSLSDEVVADKAVFHAPKPGEVRQDATVTNLDNDENFSAHLARLAKGEGSK